MTRNASTVMLENAALLQWARAYRGETLQEVPGVLRVLVNPATGAAHAEYDTEGDKSWHGLQQTGSGR